MVLTGVEYLAPLTKCSPINKSKLPIIVIAQFCCTALWFAGNGVMGNLVAEFLLPAAALGHLTSAVQFGFITGTLLLGLLMLADRFSPSRIFFVSALAGALANLGIITSGHTLFSLLFLRFLTGFFLAGIYPVGMKIAADYYDKKLGRSLGYLVGALVVGTAFPHLLKGLVGAAFPWRWVMMVTSGLAVAGGVAILLMVPDGPHRKPGQRLVPRAILKVFGFPKFRAAALGYFGHMWELYAFWAFIPVMLATYQKLHIEVVFDNSWWSFFIIAIGGVACVGSGQLSLCWGTANTAKWALRMSGICCCLSPLFFYLPFPALFLGFLLFWGIVVIADSPLFSTLVAQNAPPEIKGTALTIVNCIGFSVTIISIQLLTGLSELIDGQWLFVILGLGPMVGLWSNSRNNFSD